MLCRAATLINKTQLELSPRFEDLCSRIISLCNSKSSKLGICVHSPIIKLHLHNENHLYINNNLLSLYSKCVGLDYARQLFDEMSSRDVVSWTGIISAYVKRNKHGEALDVFDSMNLSGQCPNEFTLSKVLCSCSAAGELNYGRRIHGSVVKLGFESNEVLNTCLIDFYSKFDCIEEACKVFSFVGSDDVVSWTTMISSFAKAEKWSQAFGLYIDMVQAEVSPNEFTFVELLLASSFLGLNFGKLVHARMIRSGVELNLVVKTALVDMYLRCKRVEDGVNVSKLTPEFDVQLWTAIISGLVQNSKFDMAVAAFREMEFSGISANNVTYLSMLGACTSILSLDMGRQIHSRVITTGLEDDIRVGNALVDLYMKCSCRIDDGLRMFSEITSPNVISWTCLIAGFVDHGLVDDSFDLFTDMRAVRVQPNSTTLSIILRACSAVESGIQTSKLHGFIIKTNLDHDLVVGNALLDAYAGSGENDNAWRVVGEMKRRDAVTYTSLATRFNQTGHHDLALKVIGHMCNDCIKIDRFSLPCFLSASTASGRKETGKQLHCYSVKAGLSSCISVSNSLIDFYGKSGLILEAGKAFREVISPDVVSWNGLISGFVSNGQISSALTAFDEMRLMGVKPDYVTFHILLSGCIHGGLADLGLQYFHSMRDEHKVDPGLDHYVALVHLLGRAGRLQEAMDTIKTMPFEPNASIYKKLLAACRVHRNVALGEDVARRGLELAPFDSGFYMLLAKLYDDCGLFDLAEKARTEMKI